MKSTYNKIEQHSTYTQGLRMGDQITLYPLQGRKKIINLNRLEYSIRAHDRPQIVQMGSQIFLPQHRKFQYQLKLTAEESHSRQHHLARYQLISVGEPFRLNFNTCFRSFVERGDHLMLGFARCLLGTERKNDTENFPNDWNHQINKKDVNILLLGETGTGKTHLAQAIHQASDRNGRFVHLNLSAFPPQLIESELFGHTKGAFTGAIKNKMGAIQEANHGTLFLDEIDSIDHNLQTKLLLFLDNHQYRQVGGTHHQQADVRLIFAANKSLETLVHGQQMRWDFYFRLTTGHTHQLPPSPSQTSFNRRFLPSFCRSIQTANTGRFDLLL